MTRLSVIFREWKPSSNSKKLLVVRPLLASGCFSLLAQKELWKHLKKVKVYQLHPWECGGQAVPDVRCTYMEVCHPSRDKWMVDASSQA
jgi:hypothetical protein